MATKKSRKREAAMVALYEAIIYLSVVTRQIRYNDLQLAPQIVTAMAELATAVSGLEMEERYREKA